LSSQLPNRMALPNLEMLKRMNLVMKVALTGQIWVHVKKKKRKLINLQPRLLVQGQPSIKAVLLLIKTLLLLVLV